MAKNLKKAIKGLIIRFVEFWAEETPNPEVGKLNLCEKLIIIQDAIIGKPQVRKSLTILDEVYLDLIEAYDNTLYDEYEELKDEPDEYFFLDGIYWGPEEPIDFVEEYEEVETLEERRLKALREYDVLFGEDLSDYNKGPIFGRDGAAEFATKLYEAHKGSDYEDVNARGVAIKMLNFLEWTPRTEFSYGEIQARLDY